MKMTTQTATIMVTWEETDNGGRLIARCDENPTLNSNTVKWDEPITASSDAHAIAHAVTSLTGVEIVSVDHDREYVHVTVDDSRNG
jgi:hypothetical protein